MQRIRTLREKSAPQEGFENHEDKSDKYLFKIFRTIFLNIGASGSKQISFLFFKVALQKEKGDSSMSAGAEDPGRGGFPLAKIPVYTTEHEDLHHFYFGAMRSSGDHLQISDHFGRHRGCEG